MIIEAKAIKLIEIYMYVCEKYDSDLRYYCERFSNNASPELSDQEIMTIYLFAIIEEQKFKVKQIHRYANEYLRSWFPKPGSYAAFTNRVNRLSEAFRHFPDIVIKEARPDDCFHHQSLLDSMPIITCSGKRAGKVATDITNKGFCSTKNMYYYGLKLHAIGYRRHSKLPWPEYLVCSPASENDLAVFKECCSGIAHRTFFGDKIYFDIPFFKKLQEENQSEMLTPIKAVKGQPDSNKNFDRAFNDLFSKAVSAVRQPIEGLFNWLIEKTNIQVASKVRSTKGLLVHMFGKLSAAFLPFALNS